MCGFCGFTGFLTDLNESKKVINNMTERIKHRGPNSRGFHVSEDISIGFCRLSLIDLQNGLQPMYNIDRSLVIVFNGEIYNYRELRDSLISRGYLFSTNSDTEVLMHLYEEYKEDMLSHIRGMFAFVIYDIANRELFAARDFFGIKPLYYAKVDGDNLIFASEIKSFMDYTGFRKDLNQKALEQYLSFQYSVLEETFFKGVYRLKPGHYLKFKAGELSINKYFSIEFEESYDDLKDVVTNIDKVMKESIAAHELSDVEIGSFLSSGVDSSYIASCFGGNKAFTVGFDYDDYNEINYARSLANKKGLEHYHKVISKSDFFNSLPKIMYHMDEPLADPSAVPLYFLSDLASSHVKAVLSGEGADELFGGYNIYREPNSLKAMSMLPKMFIRALYRVSKLIPFRVLPGRNFLYRASLRVEERFIGNAYIFKPHERQAVLKHTFADNTPYDLTKTYYKEVADQNDITKMQYIDINFWLPGDILQKADKMGMAHSLEIRVPYLDKNVYNLARLLMQKHKVYKKQTKRALRMAASKNIPQEVANKKKLGFPVPLRVWLKEDEVYNIIKKAFISTNCEQYFEVDELVRLLDEHKEGKADNSRKIWTIYVFYIWYEQFFNGLGEIYE